MTVEAPGVRFKASRALSPAELAALERLEAACLAADGGRLKLEYRTLRRRRGDRPSDYTMWAEERAEERAQRRSEERTEERAEGEMVGFVGLYQWRPDEIELTGMVHPRFRRRGIFSRLYAEALSEVQRRRVARLLLVMDRDWQPAHAFAEGRAARYHSSEHRMVQNEDPGPFDRRLDVVVREAGPDDEEFVVDCLSQAFNLPRAPFDRESSRASVDSMLVVECSGERVGTLRVEQSSNEAAPTAGIYGFGVLPAHQGRGIGRHVLTELTSSLRREGVKRVTLEVAVSNDSALRLYERCGFERLGTDDYYLVEPLVAPLEGAGGGIALHPSGSG